jgi:putative aldouronate transport system permease protein
MKKSPDTIAINVIAWAVVGLLSLLAVVPFLILIVNSLSSEHSIINFGYQLWPKEFSTGAYEMIFQNPKKILNVYGITIFVTGVGTTVSLLLSSMAAYVMARKEVRYRNLLSFFLYFTQLFNGGLVTYYLLVSRDLHLSNSLLVLILVPMFSVMNILILRNYMSNAIPESIIESARIDGMDDIGIFFRIVLPLSAPVLASIGLFTALGYWNDWWTPMMFVQKQELQPLQYTLYQMLASITYTAQMVNNMPTVNLPKESLKLAMTVVATGPIILVYPFIQKHFVSGITIGSVKG